VWFAFAARRRRELTKRIDRLVSDRRPASPPPQGLSIRVRRKQAPRLQQLGRLLKIPMDLPLAHVIPAPLVFVVATAAALGAAWVSHFLTSQAISTAAGCAAWLVVVRTLFGWELGRYQAKLIRQLPDTIQLVVSATRAGLPVSEAFNAIAEEMASPTRDEFVRVGREMTLGGAADEALLAMHERTGVPEYAIFAVTIGVQARSGGRLAETIQNLAETVRERLAISARAHALAGEAKLSAVFMCILPVLAGFYLSLVNPKHMSILFNDPRGIRMLSLGVVTLVFGIISMQKLIAGAVKG
jgi:tight adherence protein B